MRAIKGVTLGALSLNINDMNLPPLVNKVPGSMENKVGDSLALPNGQITRSRAKRYGAAMSLYIQD
ncbi:hypothetical protein JCGZ_05436 [Jatropha curcas]|uniref:Uncharacterized protein n=1 Tax=Jatropha curcas TaxID=180498 RepID=A0A067LIB0_JATCU|nr:hypothetical protein JCGZ_05436 [Jatropha curcas]